jgi:integrase
VSDGINCLLHLHSDATSQLFNGRNLHKLAIQMGTSVGMLEQHYSKLTLMLMAKKFSGGYATSIYS